MTGLSVTWIWAIAGVVMIAFELVLPGLVAVFLGAAALLVAAARALGWIDGIANSFTAWFISSIVLAVGLRRVLTRFLPGSADHEETSEAADYLGRIVDVIEDISPDVQGRIRLEGTSWQARSLEGSIAAGRKAKIVFRDNVAFVVEPTGDMNPPHPS